MQWMTVTSIVPYHALHVPQHVAVSLSEPLNLMISSAPSTETVFAYLDQAYPDTQVLFWNYLFLRFKLIENRPMKVYAWTLLTPGAWPNLTQGHDWHNLQWGLPNIATNKI